MISDVYEKLKMTGIQAHNLQSVGELLTRESLRYQARG